MVKHLGGEAECRGLGKVSLNEMREKGMEMEGWAREIPGYQPQVNICSCVCRNSQGSALAWDTVFQ